RPRPNIVMIMTDDQRLDDMWVLPQTQQLIADAGTTFKNFYVSYPLCCPSRTTFLTGQYAHNHGVLSNKAPNGGYHALIPTEHNPLPIWLQQAGYFTSLIGKYLNGYATQVPAETVPPGWDHWQGLVFPYSVYDYTINDNGVLQRYGEDPTDYQTDVIA